MECGDRRKDDDTLVALSPVLETRRQAGVATAAEFLDWALLFLKGKTIDHVFELVSVALNTYDGCDGQGSRQGAILTGRLEIFDGFDEEGLKLRGQGVHPVPEGDQLLQSILDGSRRHIRGGVDRVRRWWGFIGVVRIKRLVFHTGMSECCATLTNTQQGGFGRTLS